MPRLDAERIALWRQYGIVATRLQRVVDQELVDEHGLPLAWFEALTVVRTAGGSMRVHELCEALDEVPSSLSRRLGRMEEDGLLRRRHTPLPDDRRAVTVTITAEGKRRWRDANTTYRRLVQQHFARRLTDTDIAALQRVWSKLGAP